jgi:hypothetical protein
VCERERESVCVCVSVCARTRACVCACVPIQLPEYSRLEDARQSQREFQSAYIGVSVVPLVLDGRDEEGENLLEKVELHRWQKQEEVLQCRDLLFAVCTAHNVLEEVAQLLGNERITRGKIRLDGGHEIVHRNRLDLAVVAKKPVRQNVRPTNRLRQWSCGEEGCSQGGRGRSGEMEGCVQ